jgi:hypothetical protein
MTDEIPLGPLIYAGLKFRKAYEEALNIYNENRSNNQDTVNYSLFGIYDFFSKIFSPLLEELQESADGGAREFLKKYREFEPILKIFLKHG